MWYASSPISTTLFGTIHLKSPKILSISLHLPYEKYSKALQNRQGRVKYHIHKSVLVSQTITGLEHTREIPRYWLIFNQNPAIKTVGP